MRHKQQRPDFFDHAAFFAAVPPAGKGAAVSHLAMPMRAMPNRAELRRVQARARHQWARIEDLGQLVSTSEADDADAPSTRRSTGADHFRSALAGRACPT